MAYTKDQIIDALRKAVGGTTYGDDLIEKIETIPLAHAFLDERLDETLGVLKAYERINRDSSEVAKATPEAETIVIAEKALEAVKILEKPYTKDQIIDTLKKAVGGTTYGDDLIKRIETTPLAHVYLEDHLEEVIGVLKAYVRIYESSSEEVKETPIDEKIALIEKALKAVEEL